MSEFKFISDSEFKERVKNEQSLDSTGVWKTHTPEVRAVDKEKRVIDFVISTESTDRMGDQIAVSGWQLNNFKENPVVLFGHDHGSPPIGRAIEIRKRPKKKTLEAKAEFMDKDISPFADTIFQMFVNGFMRATSVGFVPLEFEFSQDEGREMGIDFKKQDLLEFSAVSVPANPEALMGARSKGIDTAPLYNWAEETLDDYETHEKSGLVIPRKTVEQIRSKTDPKQKKTYSMDPEQARELARKNLDAISEQQTDRQEIRGAISYGQAHSDGTPTAPKDESWDGPDEVAEASIDDLQVMSAWRKDEPTGDDGEFNKGDFKLPHHRATGEHAVVWRAVANAAARLPQTDMPEDDVPGVQDHLGKHYAEFDETPPWEEQEEAWKEYVATTHKVIDQYKHGLVDSTKDLLPLRDIGLKLFAQENIDPVILDMVDRYDLEKQPLPEVEKAVTEPDTDDEDEVIEIDNTPKTKEVDDDVEKDETDTDEGVRPAETDPKDLSEDKDVDDEEDVDKALEIDPYTVAESLLEMMELTFDMVESGELDIKEFQANRRGRRVLSNIIEVGKEFSDTLKDYAEKQAESEEEKDTDPDDETEYVEIDDWDESVEKDADSDDDEIELDDISSDELKKIIAEEISSITREEIEKEKKRLRGSPD